MRLMLLAASAALVLASGPTWANDHIVEARATGPRGETDHSVQNDSTEPGVQTIDTVVVARNAPSQAFVQAATSTHLDLVPNQVAFSQVIQSLSGGGVKGLSEGFGETIATYRDTVTLNGSAAQAGMLVTLHNVMTLQPSNNSESLTNPTVPGDFTFADTHGELDIAGTGIGPGPFGGSEFMSFDHQYRNSSAFSSSDNLAPDTIDFAMNFVVGQARDIGITQQLTVSTDLDDLFGGADPVLNTFAAWELAWGDNFFVTLDDAQGHDTGVRVSGLTSTSTSGFQYLAGQASGAVPEPAGWALLILGFGGAGAMLRRRAAAA